MLCALTVRHLKPGSFDRFREEFLREIDPDSPPPGWVRFNMIRNADDPDEVITFGFFDGTLDDLRANSSDAMRSRQQEAIAPFVEGVGADGLYEVVEDFAMRPPATA